jgi:hypothetical protein
MLKCKGVFSLPISLASARAKILFKRIEEIKVFRNRAEAFIPLRITGDAEDFATYVS